MADATADAARQRQSTPTTVVPTAAIPVDLPSPAAEPSHAVTPVVVRRPGQPVGAEARWKILYRHLEMLQPGEMFTWEQMGRMLGLEVDERRGSLSSVFRRAAEELLTEHRRAVVSVRGVGWRIATPDEQLNNARRHQRRAAAEVRRGLAQAEGVDLDQLDSTTAKAFGVVAAAFRQQQAVITALDVRQSRLESVMAAVQQGQRRTEQAVETAQDNVHNLLERVTALERSQGIVPREP